MELTQKLAKSWLKEFEKIMKTNKTHLDRIDGQFGAGKFGSVMVQSIVEMQMNLMIKNPGSGPAVLQLAGGHLIAHRLGFGGLLLGTFLQTMGDCYSSSPGADFERVIAVVATAISEAGECHPGDKTALDVLVPYAQLLTDGKGKLPDYDRIIQLGEATAQMSAKYGRASYYGDRTIGYPDVGALMIAYLLAALSKVVNPAKSAGPQWSGF